MPDCVRLFLKSAADLSRRQGGSPPRLRVRDMVPGLAHLQKTDPRGFHVAVRDGRVIAFASTIRRGRTHFLSMFWALPSIQSKGVGRRLLTRAFEKPRPPKSAVRCVYASLDQRAQALYLKFGMRPRGMFYLLIGPPKRSARPRRVVELAQVGEPEKVTREMLAIAARYDRRFRAARRDADIQFLMRLPGARFFRVQVRGRQRGYCILNEKGRVGPACVTDASYSAGLAWAIKEKAREMGAERIVIVAPGVNAGALEVYFRAGLRTEFFGAWMSAEPLGSMESYLLAGGMLL